MLYQKMLSSRLAKTTLAVLIVVCVVGIAIQLPHILLRFFTFGIPVTYLPVFLSLFLLSYADFLLLISVYCAVFWVFLTAFRDGDAHALFNFGIGTSDLLRVVFWFVLPFSLFIAVCSVYIEPQVAQYMMWLETRLASDHATDQLTPGVFHEFGDQQRLSYFMPDPSVHAAQPDAFLHLWSADKEEVVYTKALSVTQKAHQYAFHCDAGVLAVQVPHARISHWVLSFASFTFHLPIYGIHGARRLSAESTPILWSRYSQADQSVLMARFSPAVMLIFLSLLAVPMAYLRPRSSYFAVKLFLSMTALVVYISLVHIVRQSILQGVFSLTVGFWGMHVLAMLVLVLSLAYRTFFYKRVKKHLESFFQ